MAPSALQCFLLLLTLTAAAASTIVEPAWEREMAYIRDWVESKFSDRLHAFKDELSASRLEAFASELGVSSPQATEVGVGAAEMPETLGKEALSEKVANLIFVDQPIGTGFSYSHDPRDIVHTEKGVSEDMYDFLLAFYAAHPEYQDHDLFITGESYAGHFVPAVAAKVHAMNKAKQGPHLNLKGIAIGNGLTQPDIQYGAYANYAYQNQLIAKTTYEALRVKYPVCATAIHACGTNGSVSCVAAFYICQTIVDPILAEANNMNIYDIRKKCDFGPPLPEIQTAMLADIMRSLEPKIPALLEDGIRFLNFAGEDDFICNWIGNSRWMAAMEWSGQEAYNKAPWVNFTVDREFASNFTGTDLLGFLKVKDAGHMVAMDQPRNALEMMRRFLRGERMGSGRANFLDHVV
ncbi:Serine carboxypeptidase [Klebsormidium nitens]|uniref:Carboxypeptidase n=1 Tax=Klebsormidium nitens TaxID=105231 RepID=A0A1Y1IN16_KLENI|nr:Serine carboxypeptidase [Klebsormidium nitens]|eukprot:GAQ90007.1 Serine carboxypeptidase [Klebsormidium nitens]